MTTTHISIRRGMSHFQLVLPDYLLIFYISSLSLISFADFGIPWRHSVEQSNESIQRHHSPCLDRDTSDSFKARRHCFWLTLSNASCHLTLLHITLLLAEPQWLPRRKCEYLFWKRNRQLYISSGISQRFNLHHCIPTQAKYQTTYFNIIRTEPGVVNFTSCIPLTAYTTAISLLDAGWRTVTF